MTISDIFKKYNKGQEHRAALEQEISALEKKRADAEKTAEEAAEAGDVDKFLKEKAAGERAAAEIYVRQLQLKKTDSPVSLEEAQDAWNEYSKDINGKVKKAWSEYTQARADLAKKLLNIIEIERPAMQIRQDLAALADENILTDQFNRGRLAQTFPLAGISNADIMNDREMFKRCGLITVEQDQLIGAVTISGRV